jgi:hypothetical protein
MQKHSTGSSHDGTTRVPIEVLQLPPPGPLVSVRRPRQGAGRRIVLGSVLFLLLAGGAGAGLYVLMQEQPTPVEKPGKPAHPAPAVVAQVPTAAETKRADRPKPKVPPIVAKKPPPVIAKKPPPRVDPAVQQARFQEEPADPVLPTKKRVLLTVNKAKIAQGIERGVAYLRQHIDPSGTWKPEEKLNPVGHAALPALALLECDVPATDPAVQAAAGYVRKHAQTVDETYDIGCAVLFLDRLGDPADRPLIRALALRLAAGEAPSGGWGYQCPRLDVKTAEELCAFLEKNRPRIEPPGGGPPGKGQKDAPAEAGQRLPELLRLARLPVVKLVLKEGLSESPSSRGDNSNTQFALLGLWVARRHGIPVEASLEFASRHFRTTQNEDGGWPYVTGPTKNTMTCVGLVALAMGHGAAAEAFQESTRRGGKPPRPPVDDPAIKDALDLLVRYLDGGKEVRGLESRIDLYFLWALERVGVLYQRETFGKFDWYQWGAQEILSRQEADGRWAVHYHPAIDTSFALLFLKRSNLARNLTEDLTNYLAIVEPGGRGK